MNPRIIPATCDTNEPEDINDAAVFEHSPATYVTVNPLLPHVPLHPITEEENNCAFNSAVNPLDESFSVKRAVGEIAYAYRHKSLFERMQELTEYPAKLALTDDWSLSWSETSPCAASNKGLLLPHAKPLTRDERHAIYESIYDSIGPPNGIQECQGTYRKHMQARTKLYFEGLLSVPYQPPQPPVRASTLSDRKPPLGTNEFRHWLSETQFLKRDGTNGSPRLYPNHQNANVAKHQEMDGISDKQYRQISIPNWIKTLDDLFPALGGNLNSDDTITDSPVIHSRQVAQLMAQPRVNADKWSAGGWSLFPSITAQAYLSYRSQHQSPKLHKLATLNSTDLRASQEYSKSNLLECHLLNWTVILTGWDMFHMLLLQGSPPP